MTWTHFILYWPFMWGVHTSPMVSLHKGPVTRIFDDDRRYRYGDNPCILCGHTLQNYVLNHIWYNGKHRFVLFSSSLIANSEHVGTTWAAGIKGFPRHVFLVKCSVFCGLIDLLISCRDQNVPLYRFVYPSPSCNRSHNCCMTSCLHV